MANIKITYDISRYIKYIFMYTFNSVLIKLYVCVCVTCVSACVILIVYTVLANIIVIFYYYWAIIYNCTSMIRLGCERCTSVRIK